MDALYKKRYPIGEFERPEVFDLNQIKQWIADIEGFPKQMRAFYEALPEEAWDKPYREGGWTLRQLAHHCADSHLNSYMRFKLAVTENEPTIKPYHEALWADLKDSMDLSPMLSVVLLESLHARWVCFLKSLEENQLKMRFFHPEFDEPLTVWENIALYSWHCRHHLQHALRA